MTVRTHMAGVKSFYKNNDISLPASLPKIGSRAVTLEENKPIPSKEDLRAVLKICDPLERAILLVGASSGLGCEDIIKLTVRQLKKGYNQQTEITTLQLRRTKTKVDFITFLSPEASRAVWDYLEFRKRTVNEGERRQPTLEKQHVYSDNDYLFIGRHIPDSFLKTRDDNERRLKEKGLIQIFSNISIKAKKSTIKGQWNLIRSHKMRGFFNTELKTRGCDSFHVEFWMGHKLDGSKAGYFLGNPEGERELYAQYIPYLTIQKEANVSESPEFQRLLKDNKILASETARHVVDNSELQDLRVELEKATQKIMEADAEIHFMKEDMELSAEAKYQDKLKEMDDRMKAMNELFTGMLKGKDEKKLKEQAEDVDVWE
jgi:integrase